MRVVSDRGATALANRLLEWLSQSWEYGDTAYAIHRSGSESATAAILDPAGLFIADVTKHEPESNYGPERITCKCGWDPSDSPVWDESYFDHITEDPR